MADTEQRQIQQLRKSGENGRKDCPRKNLRTVKNRWSYEVTLLFPLLSKDWRDSGRLS